MTRPWMLDDKGYSERQIQALIDNAKDILRIVGASTESRAEAVFSALDDYCFHVPGCEPGDRCVSGEEGVREKMAREPHTKDSDCTLGPDDCCTLCGVLHGDECTSCGGRAFHLPDCDTLRALASDDDAAHDHAFDEER